MEVAGHWRKLPPSLCFFICMAMITISIDVEGSLLEISPSTTQYFRRTSLPVRNMSLLNPPQLVKPIVNGSFIVISWKRTNQTSLVNHTIQICHPCGNCTNTTLVNIVGKTETYKHRLPVNDTCYQITIKSCSGLSCGRLSKIVKVNLTRIPITSPTSAKEQASSSTRHLHSSSTSYLPTPDPSKPGARKSKDSSVGVIAGCVVASVLIVIIVILIVLKLRPRWTKGKNKGPRSINATKGKAHKAQDKKDQQTKQHQIGLSNRGFELSSPLPKGDETSPGSKKTRSRSFFRTKSATVDQEINCFTDKGEGTGSDSRQPTALQRNASTRPGMAKEVVTIDGGTLKTEDVTLHVGPGCLSKDTEITMIMDDHNFAFKSLLDLGLLKVAPRVIEFLPDGLKFVKTADLSIHLKDVVSSELFVLHGSYDSEKERTIWTVVTDEININVQEGCVNMKISGFCFYSYIRSTRGKLARILSHLNNSFSCYAVGLYRRIPTFPNVDVAVVLLSEFVQMHEDECNVSQLSMMIKDNKYHTSETGSLKRVDTHRRLEMRLELPEAKAIEPLVFKVDVAQLDSVGMVLDHFREVYQEFPARGKVFIYEVYRDIRRLLWTLNIIENEQTISPTSVEAVSSQPDETDQNVSSVVMRTTKLSSAEISRLSLDMGVDWDSLAGLLDISYAEREELKLNINKYPNLSSKASIILSKFNKSKSFSREILVKYLEELGRHDLGKSISAGVPQAENSQEKPPQENEENPDNNNERNAVKPDTPLSSREMCRLSRSIVDWDSLAGLMDIPLATKEGIRNNNALYPDTKSRAEKILSLFNNSKAFCREKLAGYLKETGHHDLIKTVRNGSYRCL